MAVIAVDASDRVLFIHVRSRYTTHDLINNLLQLKPLRALSDTGRVAVNTTVGIAGLIDVATPMGLEKTGEDFGQTLGYWGVPAGPYIVWPFLGPSNLRDSVGMAGDWYMDPLNYAATPDWPKRWNYGVTENWQWGLWLLSYVDTRADLLSAEELLDVAALDRYTFLRDAYLQRRQNLINDSSNAPATREESEAASDDW
jgi:phospholipid-binding lipoprotein MlaA